MSGEPEHLSEYDNREQSKIKHFVLKSYLEAATRILGPSKTFRFVDCCAGPWNSQSTSYSDTSFGIAFAVFVASSEDLRRYGKAFKSTALLIERRKSSFELLEAFAEAYSRAECKLHARNWDFSRRKADIVRFAAKPGGFAFTFIDPTGWKLAGIPAIRELLQIAPGEVLINFMSSFITRFLKLPNAGVKEMLGGDVSYLTDLSGYEREAALVQHYCDQVKTVGNFQYVCSLPVFKPKSDAIHFYLIYATRHHKGVEVFKDVERRTEALTRTMRAELQRQRRETKTGNLDLFEPDAYYREDRYLQFRETHHSIARQRVSDLIDKKTFVSYDDCWAEALQFASVQQMHLRQWLTELERNHHIVVTGRKRAGEVLKVRSGHSLKKIEA